MIHSMTGYAAAVRETDGGSLHLEIKSVNNRFLDVSFRVSDTLQALESALRGKIAARIQRGKVECRLFFRRANSGKKGILNEAALRELGDLETHIRAVLPDAKPFSVAEAINFPGVWSMDGDVAMPTDNATLQEAAVALAEQALDELIASRAREGEKLIRMILERGAKMREIIEHIKPLLPAAEAEYLAYLRQRMSVLMPGSVDESMEKRLLQETMLFAAKGDVAEEITRLQTHLDELDHIGKVGGAVGKRLDFLTQELNREANTLASKAVSTNINQAAMELKLLIEQIREQAQNIE